MLKKIQAWFKGKFYGRGYPRTVRTSSAPGSPSASRPVTVPVAKGFELEGLGILGQGQTDKKG